MSLEAHYALRKQPLISLVSELIAVIIDHCRTGGKPPVKVVYILIAAAAAMAKSLPRLRSHSIAAFKSSSDMTVPKTLTALKSPHYSNPSL